MKYKIAIFGSCVTRDAFNLRKGENFEVCDYFARSSLATLNAAPFDGTIFLNNIPSEFQRRMVRRDFEKLFPIEINNLVIDGIILDLIDERFNLLSLPDGVILTESSELTISGITKSPNVNFTRISHNSKEKRELWLRGLETFLNTIEKCRLSNRLLINKVYWASTIDGNRSFDDKTKIQIEIANNELHWMYERISNLYAPTIFLEYEKNLFIANPNHLWGLSPFHYIERLYEQTLAQLDSRFAALRNDLD
jgi:hypothetical protein